MVKLALILVLTMICLLIGMIVHLGERTSLAFVYASNDLSESSGAIPENIQKRQQQTGNSSDVKSEGATTENAEKNQSREPQGTTVETGKKLRITILSLTVLKTHLDQPSALWKVWVGVKDNSTIPVEQKEDVVIMNWVPVTSTSTVNLYPYDDWYYPFQPNSNVTYFDIYVPDYQGEETNTGLLIYAYGSVSSDSKVITPEDNKLGNISEFYTDDEAYGLGQHHPHSSKEDYILAYRIDDIDQPTNLQSSRDLSVSDILNMLNNTNLNMLNNTNTK